MGDVGAGELLIIALLLLVFFGSKRIPEIARGIGEGIRELKKATNEAYDEDEGPKLAEPQSQEVNKR